MCNLEERITATKESEADDHVLVSMGPVFGSLANTACLVVMFGTHLFSLPVYYSGILYTETVVSGDKFFIAFCPLQVYYSTWIIQCRSWS